MATYLENLITSRDKAAEGLAAAMTASVAGTAGEIGGALNSTISQVDHDARIREYRATIRELNADIAAAGGATMPDPFELRTEGIA